jgi:hypothetical protein
MQRLLALLLLTGCAVAQDAPPASKSVHLTEVPKVSAQVTERLVPASHADMYCSGFLAKEPARKDTYVLGGTDSPNQQRFHTHDFLFINGDYEVGTRISFVRQTKDVDRMEAFNGQANALKSTGDVFGDLGYAVVVEKRGNATVAQVEFSCDAIVPGDYVVPFIARPEVNYRQHSTTDLFPDKPRTMGRILAARDFDQFVATGQKVYLNIGEQKGVKPGDMFYVVRNYTADEMDAADVAEFYTPVFEDSRTNEPKMRHFENRMPERVVGEAVVLSANDHSATAMVTFALSEVHVGDRIASETLTGAPEGIADNFAGHGSRLGPLCHIALLNCGTQAAINNATHEAAEQAKKQQQAADADVPAAGK